MGLGERIQLLRAEKNLTQEQLAEKLSVSRQSVSKWEMNQAVPETEKIIIMSKLFSVETDEILLDKNERSQNKHKAAENSKGYLMGLINEAIAPVLERLKELSERIEEVANEAEDARSTAEEALDEPGCLEDVNIEEQINEFFINRLCGESNINKESSQKLPSKEQENIVKYGIAKFSTDENERKQWFSERASERLAKKAFEDGKAKKQLCESDRKRRDFSRGLQQEYRCSFCDMEINGDVSQDIVGNITKDIHGSVYGSVTGNIEAQIDGDIVCKNIFGNLDGEIGGSVICGRIEDSRPYLEGLLGYMRGRIHGDMRGTIDSNLDGRIDGSMTGVIFGDLNGRVEGNVTGNIYGDLNGSVGGDVIILQKNRRGVGLKCIDGDLNGAVSGNIDGDIGGSINGVVKGNVNGNIFGDIINEIGGCINGSVYGNVDGHIGESVFGNIMGDVAGQIDGDVVGNIDGDVTGNINGKIKGNVNGNVSGVVRGGIAGVVSGVIKKLET